MIIHLKTIRHSAIRLVAVACWSVALQSASADDQNGLTAAPIEFEREIRPIFSTYCVSCHGAKTQEGGLRLDNRTDALRGGDSGKLIVAGDAFRSLLIERVTSSDESLRMPLEKPALPAVQVQLLKRWILTGAVWPAAGSATERVVSDHWSFQPIKRPPLPSLPPTQPVSNSIDAFVLNRLNKAGVNPSREADHWKLVRRLYLDLTGLPPEPSDVEAFLNDRRPDAYERLVDQLLASPHFGERWGQYWLDLARYGDSDGYEMDHARPNAWRWRDWVINAINADMPFDQFTIEQLAGDLLTEANPRQLGTGFHRNSLTNTENGIDREEFRVKAIVDRVNTTATVWLGLTIGCAECHSHKYDPIRQHEFYGLFAFFNDRVDEADIAVEPTPRDRVAFTIAQAEHESMLRKLEAESKSAAGGSRSTIEKRLDKLRKSPPQLKPIAHVFRSRAAPRQTFVHLRGNFLDKGATVSADVPRVLPPLAATDSPRNRLDLARWLVDSRNPLTARVEANRLWQYLFGFGLVRTPDDFGTQGEPPTHPKLLDWLASELQQRGWSRKQMIRTIVTSATYRQDSALRPDLSKVDPSNRLLARQNRYRLSAELVRDQFLAAAGLLNRRTGGPSFYPPLPAGLSQLGFRVDWRADPLSEQHRRGIYLVVRRNLAYPMLTTFDRPDANVTCTRRERSNTPMQSLTQLNDPLVVNCAITLATVITQETQADVGERIEHVFRRCLVRPPAAGEVRRLDDLYQRLVQIYTAEPQSAMTLIGDRGHRATNQSVELAAWTVLVRTIMNLDEFVSRE